MGKHTINVKLESDGGRRPEAVVLTMWKSFSGKEMINKPSNEEVVAESEFKVQDSATLGAVCTGGDYILVPALNKANTMGRFKIIVDTDQHEPKLSSFLKQTSQISSEWNFETGRCAGHGKPANPQFVMTIPAGEHDVTLTLTRSDGARDLGIAYWVFPYTGDGSSLATVRTGDAIGNSKFLRTNEVSSTLKLTGDKKYLVLCTVQSTELQAPFELKAVLEGTFSADLCEIKGAAPASVAARAAPLRPPTSSGGKPIGDWISVTSKWEQGRSGGYQKLDNPMFLMTAEGTGEISVKLDRLDGGNDQGMIVFVYNLTAENDNGYRVKELPGAPVVMSKFVKSDEAQCKFPKEGAGKQSFLLLACLQKSGTLVDCKVSSSGSDGAKVALKALNQDPPETASKCIGQWEGKTAAGYQKLQNPQYFLTVPNQGVVKITLERTNGAKGEGMICSVYDAPEAYDPARGPATSVGEIVAKTAYKKSSRLETEWVAKAGTYIVIPSLQKKAQEGPFELSADGGMGPTLKAV